MRSSSLQLDSRSIARQVPDNVAAQFHLKVQRLHCRNSHESSKLLPRNPPRHLGRPGAAGMIR